MRKSLNLNASAILIVSIILLLFGLIMVLSASSVVAYSWEKDSFYFLKRQIIWVIVGLGMMGFFANMDYRILRKFSLTSILLCNAFLVGVFIPGIGKSAGGAERWFSVGPVSFQPSEFAKIAIILFAADYLVKNREKLGDISTLYPLLLVSASTIGLILIQPDMGTAICICLVLLTMLFLSGLPFFYLFILGTLGSFLAFIAAISENYRKERLLAFLNPWDDPQGIGFQIIQSLLAFGSGGIFGLGIGASRQKFFYLPAAYTDFIFAIIGEELGLIGTGTVVILFFLFAYFGLRIAFQTKNDFARLVAAGITTLIVGQAVINMGAVTSALPVTGIPLPLISFGGSSLIFSMIAIGIILNIAMNRDKGKEQSESSSNRRRNSGTRLSGSLRNRRIKKANF
ncbi:MAG: putative lipid II flippase FtsW [Actinomycetia bacterium]|nr:putative lipid II flippase FtsW [Actinomycetes bacterium]